MISTKIGSKRTREGDETMSLRELDPNLRCLIEKGEWKDETQQYNFEDIYHCGIGMEIEWRGMNIVYDCDNPENKRYIVINGKRVQECPTDYSFYETDIFGVPFKQVIEECHFISLLW